MMEADDSYDDEQAKLLHSHPPSSCYSGSVDEPRILEPPKQYKSRWRSIRVMYLTMFLSSISFSICMSSVWPYLKLMDKNATADLLGWVIASYSLGQLVASPLFGAWANHRKSREPLLVSMTINIMANILYAYLEDFKHNTVWFLILARALIGFGAGNAAVVRSYVSGATTIKERTSAMANMSGCQAIGFIIGPVIQVSMVPIGYPGPVHMEAINIDLYTSPAFLSAFVGIINVVLLVAVFKEHRVKDEAYTHIQISEDEVIDYKPDIVAVLSTIALFFVVLFIFTVFETISTPLTMDMYGWTRTRATLYVGFILAGGGFVSILVFVVIKILTKRFNERYILLGGFLFCLSGFIIYLPWGHQYPPVQITEINKADVIHQNESLFTHDPRYTVTPDYNTTTPGNNTDGKSVESTGCPDSYKWCSYTPIVALPQLLCGTLMICIGYPVCNVMSYTLYSKILGPKPQGIMMGLLTSSGSLARTVGPIYVGQIYNLYGPRVTFSSMCGITVLTIIGYLMAFKRLVPLKIEQEIRSPSQSEVN